MTSGRIDSITPDWRGDTLAAPVDAADQVLTVKDTSDFDEIEGDEPRWLSVAGDPAVEYVDVDHDASTITLGAPAGVDYEAGLPVIVWDPTVDGGGAPVVEYKAKVITDRGPATVVIPHEKVPLAGAELLVGASVTLAEVGVREWVLDQIFGREALIDPDNIADPYCFGTLPADVTIPHDTWTLVTGFVTFKRDFHFDVSNPGHAYAEKDGIYPVTFGVRWRSNATGRRACKSVRHTFVGEFDQFVDSRPAEATAAMSTVSPDTIPLSKGEQVSFWVYQDSGAGLDIIGGETKFSITRGGTL